MHAPPVLPLERVVEMISPGARNKKQKRLLLYVHVPFCSSKCHFCDWVVGYDTTDLLDTGELRDRYVIALCNQIRGYGPPLSKLGYRVTNIYWGGGTPTRLSPDQIARVEQAIAEVFDLSRVGEHTAECSPETLTGEHLDAWMRAGLNRISVGVQSFDDAILRRMGRAHDVASAEAAVRLFRSAGLESFNLDLIAGFTDQSRDVMLRSIARAIELETPHVSLYMFRDFADKLVSVKQLRSGQRKQTPREERADSYFEAKVLLESAGYDEYLVGYFARGEKFRFDAEEYYFSLGGDYIGFGAGASSTLGRCAMKSAATDRYGSSQVRSFVDDPLKMIAGPIEFLPDSILFGVYFKAFATRRGLRFDAFQDQLGIDFRRLRSSRKSVRDWFVEQERAGARFIETDEGITLSDDTWIPTMIWRQ